MKQRHDQEEKIVKFARLMKVIGQQNDHCKSDFQQ